MSQRTETQLDSGRENQHVATGKSRCLSSLSRTHRLTGLPGLVPPPPQALAPSSSWAQSTSLPEKPVS